MQQIINARHQDIFSVLGPHPICDNQTEIRVFLPRAERVEVLDYNSKKPLVNLAKVDDAGFFIGIARIGLESKYFLRVTYGDFSEIIEDPYRFGPAIGEDDLYLFGEGTHEAAYKFLGAHLVTQDGVSGCRFAVWAPNAMRVSIVGDFNYWDGRKHMMRKHFPSGVWELFIPELGPGQLYKYELLDAAGHLLPHKADPYGFYAQVPPEQASCIADLSVYQWNDQDWRDRQVKFTSVDRPISIYEVHFGSWRRVVEEKNRYLSYRELARDLIPYAKEMGFTHLQLMPISEYPFDGSWGYQPIGVYAPTSRFGTPDDFKYFIDQCHQADLAVLIDWVPGHFPTDAHGLGRFDGTPLYEHQDDRQGFHPDWNTYIFNYGRREVANYLMANALFWLDEYHIDGLRVDAVASMLYLDYSRDDGEWIPNRFGGRENLEAIDFLRVLNERIYKNFPTAMMVAEESTAWPGVSRPTYQGGLGFGYKWNMGWMNDSLEYISKEAVYRQYHHNDMTFSLLYAFSENFILPLSHDEVVHGKGSILARMPGDAWQKFANLRAYYAYMWCHPGKKLLFMGNEFAQGPEWDYLNSLCWHQLDLGQHEGVQNLVRELNFLYRETPALHEMDAQAEGFEWIEADDRHNSVFSFSRHANTSESFVVVISNFTPVERNSYRIGVEKEGFYREVLNTDSEHFAGGNKGNGGGVNAEQQPWQHREFSLCVDLPALSTIVFLHEG
ncbi:MAG: 1,4-alpha-glucan branching protein GlgB [Cellvibrionaceae bacterium]|nr:1,4-alpha-glucan branching protein GlgB [Cellvibrionaceae bacterium]